MALADNARDASSAMGALASALDRIAAKNGQRVEVTIAPESIDRALVEAHRRRQLPEFTDALRKDVQR